MASMSFISYARNFEDVMLWRALRHVDKGFYIDVGAGGPTEDSVTRAFYERGWHGLNIEPAREHHAALLLARPADTNLQVVAGASAHDVVFYDVTGTLDSTLDEARARALSTEGLAVVQRQLAQQTLSALCAQHAPGEIHFMKIAAAGFEQAALAGLDLARWRPWVLVVANGAAAAWQAQVMGARYELAYNDGVNNFYVAAEHTGLRAAFATPPSPADGFVLRSDHPYAYPLADWRERVAQLETMAADADTRAQQARDWADAHARERDLQAELRERAAEARVHATEANEQALRDAHARVERAERQVQDTTAHFENAMQAIYGSMSWRLTRPLRSISFRARALRARLRESAARMRQRIGALKRGCAGALKGAVRRVMRAIMSRPALSHFVRSQIGRHPRLTNWLRVAVQRTQASPAPVSVDNPADLEHLPSAARQVLDDLRRTMKSTRPR